MSSQNSNNQIHNEIEYQEINLADPPTKFLVINSESEECDSDVAEDSWICDCKACCEVRKDKKFSLCKEISDCGIQYPDELSEMRENRVPPNKSIYDCESRSSNNEQQVIGESKLVFQKSQFLCGGSGDDGFNVNEYSGYGTCHATGCALPPASADDSSSEPRNSSGEVSTLNINVQMLTDTMHNLSELLLFHCLNDAYELKRQHLDVLKNVISNLGLCILKNCQQVIPVQECLFPQPYTYKCARESPEVQQNASLERSQSRKLVPEHANVELENPLVGEVKNHHFMFGEHWKLADSFPIKDDAEMMKEDNMIKAVKRILSDNIGDEEEAESQTLLYKNLWLEAEAALFCTNYKARYNQMKTAMEEYSHEPDKALAFGEPSKPEVLPTKQNSATDVNSGQNPDYSTQNWPVLYTANVKEPSSSRRTFDLNDPTTLEPEKKDSRKPDSFIEDSLVSGTNKVALFHILKPRLDDSSISSANTEKLLSCETSQALDSTKKLASGVTGSQHLVNFSLGPPIHILKSRAESSSSVRSEVQLLDGAGFAGSGADCKIIRTASGGEISDADTDPVMKPLTYCTTVDKSNLKEFDLNLENTQEVQSPETCRFGNQLPTDDSDSFSSDWEHV